MNKKTQLDIQKKLQSTIGEIIGIHEYSKGFLTQNYIIETTNNKFFIKKHRKESEMKIRQIEASENFFLKNGIKVLVPIAVGNKSHFNLGDDIYVLFPFINAKVVPEDQLTDNHIRLIADLLADMHHIAWSKKDQVKLPTIEDRDEVLLNDRSLKKLWNIRSVIEKRTNFDTFDKLTLKIIKIKEEYLKNNIRSVDEFNLGEKLLTHGDFHNNNIFFTSKGEIEYLFDFEKTKIDSFHHEVIRTIMICCFNHQFEEINFKRAKLFLKTYTKKHKLDKFMLKEAIEFYVTKLFYSVWIESEHYLKSNNKMDNLYKQVCKSLMYFNKHKGELVQNLTSF